MVCLSCLVPILLVPIVSLLPILFDLIVGRVCMLLGWEYRKQEKPPPSCRYKRPTYNRSKKVGMEEETSTTTELLTSSNEADGFKLE